MFTKCLKSTFNIQKCFFIKSTATPNGTLVPFRLIILSIGPKIAKKKKGEEEVNHRQILSSSVLFNPKVFDFSTMHIVQVAFFLKQYASNLLTMIPGY